MHERPTRSIAKSLSWRFFASLDTFILSLIFTGSVHAALSIGGLEVFTKLLWYYLHERAWLRISLERAHPKIAAFLAEDSSSRSIAKAVTWRFVGALDTVVIALLVTRHVGVSLSIGGTEIVTKMVLYYLHERVWLRVRWGVKNPLDESPAKGNNDTHA